MSAFLDRAKRIENLIGVVHLEEHDCIKIEPNNNPRYTDSEVYVFSKDCKLFIYGEEEILTLYIKMYVQESSNYDVVIVISFHQEGMHG